MTNNFILRLTAYLVLSVITGYLWYSTGSAAWAFACGSLITSTLSTCQIWAMEASHEVETADLRERLESVGEWAAKQMKARYDN